MKTNESNLDRILRMILGIDLFALYLLGYVGGGLRIVFDILGVMQ
jgi:hypothetical protein